MGGSSSPGPELCRAREGERRHLPAAADRQVGARHPLLDSWDSWENWGVEAQKSWLENGGCIWVCLKMRLNP